MESKILNIPYNNRLSFQFVSMVIIFLTALSLIMHRNKKFRGNIRHLSLLSFSPFTIRALLGIPKGPICELFMKMGSLLSVPYYSAPMIVISNDYETIKQIMNSPDVWTDRVKNPLLAVRANGVQDRGILASSGPVWKETRKYAVKTLTQLGLGKRSNLVYTTNEELKDLLQDAENLILTTNNRVPMKGFFSRVAINVIWRIVGGNRFLSTDKECIELVEATDTLAELSFYQIVFGDFFGGTIAQAVPGLFRLRKSVDSQAVIQKSFTTVLQSRQEALMNGNELIDDENFIDIFLRKMHGNGNNNASGKIDEIFNLDNLMVILFDLFEAGVDTTSSTLEFAVMYLAEHPKVQEKLRNEIKTVIGNKEASFYSDRSKMPYTQAVISEVHRMASIVPLNFRGAVRDCYINDIHIKKGTAAVINLYSVHYDEKFWKDPYNFRPERFLNDGGLLDTSKLRRLVNFGAGKRVCIGETVASISVFTFLVGLLQKYELQKADPKEECGMVINSSFTSRAKPFHVRFVLV